MACDISISPADVIDPNVGASIKNSGSTDITVSIKGNGGLTDSVVVPAGETRIWKPTAGWETATFSAPDCADQNRVIGARAGGGQGA